MKKQVICPYCGKPYSAYRNPTPTVDVIIHDPEKGIVLISRKNEPFGLAFPGGFIDEGEQAEAAAIREMKEETGMEIELAGLLGVYSRPDRDPRQHTISTVFVGKSKDPESLHAGDDAASAAWHKPEEAPAGMAFDHDRILRDFMQYLEGRRALAPIQPLT